MRRTILAMLTIAFGFLYSCTNTNSTESTHSFAGTFITENGVRFELRADSTTLITFSDSVKYEGTWKSCKAEDHLEYANIEFGGYQEYYYLKDEKLYRSEREMRHDALGAEQGDDFSAAGFETEVADSCNFAEIFCQTGYFNGYLHRILL